LFLFLLVMMIIAKTAPTPRFVLLLSALLLLLLLDSAAAKGGSCACEAEELGFAMDCTETQSMLDALRILKDQDCATDCSSAACEKNYYIVQAHHDFCPKEDIPEEIEDGFHDFDESCVACAIQRGLVDASDANSTAMKCPAVGCGDDDDIGNDAYTALVENGCNIVCGSEVCRDLFLVMRVVHDICDHGTLRQVAEEGLHDLERPCAEHVCLLPNQEGAVDPLECVPEEEDDPHAGHDHGSHDEEGGTSDDSGTASAVHNTGLVAVLAAMAMVAF